MNLKDNRKESTVNETEKKFAFCKEKGILGIGWVSYEENGIEDLGFKKAKNAIIRFKPKDLVWVKNTAKKEYYICEIAENKDEYIDKEECKKYDISEYKPCKYYYVGSSEKLPASITERDLVATSTIQQANEDVANATELFFNRFVLKNEDTNSVSIKSKNNNIKLILLPIIGALVAVTVIACLAKRNNAIELEKNKVISFVNGKTYSVEQTDKYEGVNNLKEVWNCTFNSENNVNGVVIDQLICNSSGNKFFAYDEGYKKASFSIDTNKKRITIDTDGNILKSVNYKIGANNSIELEEFNGSERTKPVLNDDIDVTEIIQKVAYFWDAACKNYINNYKQNFDTSNSLVLKDTVLRDNIGGSIGYIGGINIPTRWSNEFVSSYSYNANKLYSNKTLDYIIDPAILFLKDIPTAITDKTILLQKFQENTNEEKGSWKHCSFEKDGLKYELCYDNDPSSSTLQNGFSIKIGINSNFKVGNSDEIQKILTE